MHSQPIMNRTLDHYNEEAFGMTRVNSNTYFSSTVYGPDSLIDSAFVTCIDPAGQVVFRRNVFKNAFTVITKLITTNDNQLALIGWSNSCDVIDSSSRTFFMKLNASFGFTILDRNFLPRDLSDNFRDLVQYSDSSYFVITDSLLFHFSKTGAQYSLRNTGLNSLQSLTIDAAGHLVLTSNTGNPSNNLISVIDTTGALISQQSINGTSIKTVYHNTWGLYTLNGIIEKRNAAAQVVTTSSLAQDSLNGNRVSDFVLHNDTIYACGYNILNSSSFILCLDTSLNLLSNSVNAAPGIRPITIARDTRTTILINSQSIPTTLNLQSQPISNGITGVCSLPDHSTYAFTKDVGVVSYTVDSGFAVSSTMYMGPSTTLYQVKDKYYKVKVSVKNFGTSLVQNLQINHFLDNPIGCTMFRFDTTNFFGLHLVPGSTLVLDLGWIHRKESVMPNTSIPDSVYVNACFHTSIPDHEHDLNRDNDGICSSFMLPVVVGIKESASVESAILLFPNPTSGIVSVQTDLKILHISLTDLSGRILQKTEAASIDLSPYETGIYFVRIETDKGMTVKKVVKE
jgi:hypothetical protein